MINYCRIFLFFILGTAIFLLVSCTTQKFQPDVIHAISLYRLSVENRLRPYFKAANVNYPPQQIALLIFKKERKLELWANESGWHLIKTYRILAASGHVGPKLRAGDDQVPEGIYKITAFNPHSHFHLSLHLNYPNDFDLQHAREDRRFYPGGEIFIHGSDRSIGCIAIGNVAIEELFVLVYTVGINNTVVIIAPNDLRHASPAVYHRHEPRWVPVLYRNIAQALQPFVDG